MNATERDLFRQNLVAQLAASGAAGRSMPQLQIGAKTGGFDASPDEFANELDYLAGKGLVELKEKLLSPENRRWKITAAGRDYAAEEGLA